MKYEKFITEVKQLGVQPAPDVWKRIEYSTHSTVVFSFPRWRILLVAAVFLLAFVVPTTLLVAKQDQQEMYAYLQDFGLTEYVALASINY